MKLERLISCFDKATEELTQEYNVDFIDIDILRSIFNPPSDDKLMHKPYLININEAAELKKYIDIVFDFDRNVYQLDCFSV